MAIRVQEAASLRLDDIYRYTRDRWGAEHDGNLSSAFDRLIKRAGAFPCEADGVETRFAELFQGTRNVDRADLGDSFDRPGSALGNDAGDRRGIARLQDKAREAEGGGRAEDRAEIVRV